MLRLKVALLTALLLAGTARAQTDTSEYRISCVEVEPGVKLEVLDWDCSGEPMVFWADWGTTPTFYSKITARLWLSSSPWHLNSPSIPT